MVLEMMADRCIFSYSFLIMHMFMVHQVGYVETFTIPCNASVQTVNRVPECPTNLTSHEAAARIKNCSALLPNASECPSFKYHCVISDNLQYLVEVCAPSFYIIGHVCSKFSSQWRSIIRIDGMDCNNPKSTKKCPFAYNSTDAYQYPQCYANCSRNPSLVSEQSQRSQKTIDILPIIFGVVVSPLTVIISICCMKKCQRKKGQMSEHLEEAHISLLENLPQELANSCVGSILEREIFKHWQEEEKLFVITRASQNVENFIEKNNLVIVAGQSGCGKSAIVHHIALKLKSSGWNVKVVNSVEEIKEIYTSTSCSENNTLFVFNDPFGKESLDEILYNSWKKYQEILKIILKKVKLLLTCRTWILRDKNVNKLFEEKQLMVIVDEDENKLSDEEKKKIFQKHLPNGKFSEEELDEILKTETYFPLLCKLFASKDANSENIIIFFKTPIAVVKKEIENWKETNKEKYFGLVCLVLFKNTFCSSDLTENHKLFKECLNLCDLPDYTSPATVMNNLDQLRGYFVKKIGETYHFYHDFLMEVTTFVFGTDYPEKIIMHADIGFLCRRVRLEECGISNNSFIINLSDKYIDCLVNRFLEDIGEDRFMEVVLNPCLRNEKLTDLLIEKIKGDPAKLQMITKTTQIKYTEQKGNVVPKKSFFSRFDFVVFIGKVSPLFALIVFCHDKLAMFCLKNLGEMKTNSHKDNLFLAVCCNGSKELINVFSKDEIESCLKQRNTFHPIHIASVFHNHELLKEIKNMGIDVNIKECGPNHLTPLLLATENDSLENSEFERHDQPSRLDETVKTLLDSGAKVNLCDEKGVSALYIACIKGHYSTVDILLRRGAEVNLCEENGASPLYIACEKGHDNIVQLLLDKGADINLREDLEGASPLYVACEYEHSSTVQLLLEKGAEVNLFDKQGATPLYVACQHGFDEIVKILVAYKAEVNLRKNTGTSPLSIACHNENYSTAKLLLDRGANVNLCEKTGASPLYIASQNGYDKIVQLLLNNGANVNLCEDEGVSPLYIACEKGHDNTVELLLQNGADVNLREETGCSPLYIACENKHDSTVELLLNKGADVNLQNKKGNGPLQIASYSGHKNIVKLLLEKDPSSISCGKSNLNPVNLALQKNHGSLAELLRSYDTETS